MLGLLNHHSRPIVAYFDLSLLGWVVRRYHMLPHFLSWLFSLFSSALLHHLSHPFLFSSTLVYHHFASWMACPLAFITIIWHYSFLCRLSYWAHPILQYLTLHSQRLGIISWVFRPCFPSFHSPFTHGLHYDMSHKTTLRPRELVFASTYFIWTGSVH